MSMKRIVVTEVFSANKISPRTSADSKRPWAECIVAAYIIVFFTAKGNDCFIIVYLIFVSII